MRYRYVRFRKQNQPCRPKNWLVKKTDYNYKITDIEGKIPNNTDLATTAALTAK